MRAERPHQRTPGSATRAGEGGEGAISAQGGIGDLGARGGLNWELVRIRDDAARPVLHALRLLCGPNVRSTRVLLSPGGAAGHLEQLLRVVALVGNAGAGTQVRQLLGLEPDPSGLLALRGDGRILTLDGLVTFDGWLSSHLHPSSEYDSDGQAGADTGAIATLANFSSWRALGLGFGLSMPIRFRQDTGGGALGGNATANRNTRDKVRVWGVLAPHDSRRDDYADPSNLGKDPRTYTPYLTHAPLIEIDLDEIIGDDEPPPKKRKPHGDPPPPGGDPEDEEEGQDDTEPPDPPQPPPNPQDPAIFADPSAGGVPQEDFLVGQPSVGTVSSPTTEAFVTETGNAVNPHPISWSPDDEDLEDFVAGGTPSSGAPTSAPCPLEPLPPDPSSEEAGTIPTSNPGTNPDPGPRPPKPEWLPDSGDPGRPSDSPPDLGPTGFVSP